jgi:hypothetical protein
MYITAGKTRVRNTQVEALHLAMTDLDDLKDDARAHLSD